MVKLPFTLPKAAAIAVIVFLGLFFLAISCEEAEADTILEVGAGVLSGEFSGTPILIVAERFQGKYDIGVGLVGEQTCECGDFKLDLEKETPVPTLAMIFVQRVVTWKRVELGLGFGFWNKTSRVSGSVLMLPLSLKLKLTDRLSLGVRHFSTGGSGRPNLGQDMVSLSWRF